ncbi:MAG: transglutaminase TgpA family protein [Myxococcaceae bacterium]
MIAPSRVRLRLALRDLASAAAFASIAVSGSVPLWAVAGFAVGLVLSLLGLRLLARRGVVAAVGLAAAAVVLFSSTLRGSLDLVVAACSFAALVTVHRMLSPPAPATDNQVHLTSLLMITGGAALSGEMMFAVCLAMFGVLGSLSLSLAVLEGAPGDEEEVPVAGMLRRVGAGALVALLGGAVFFVAFPRLSWNVAARRTSPGLGPATTGFSDRIRLGGGGNIKTNPRLVLRATLSPDPGRERLDAYWVGRTFKTFTGREWLGHGTARPPRQLVTLGPSARDLVHQRIELLPAYDSRTLVALEPAVMVGNAQARSQTGTSRASLVEVTGEEVHFLEPAVAYSYHAYSLPEGSTPQAAEPADLADYLDPPPGLDDRVGKLAKQVVGGERDPLAAALLLRDHLRSNFRYTLELPGEVEDPLANFLFERKEGHCEHFATALTVLLRAGGFPARVAAGFYGGERLAGHYVVRAGDAHAWAQVYVPGQGFVSVDATPAEGRAASPSATWAWLISRYEELEALWRTSVIDYTLRDQADLARSLVRPPSQGGRAEGRLPDSRAWLAAAVLTLVVYAAWRAGKLRRRARPNPLASFAQAIERALEASGVERFEDEPLEEQSARLRAAGHPMAPALTLATRRYLEARFGGRPLRQGEREALLSPLRRTPARRAA